MKKIIYISIAVIMTLALLTAFEFRLVNVQSSSAVKKAIFLMVLNAHLLALISIVYLSIKNVRMLILEKRADVAGHRFKTRMALIFVIFTAIPSVLLFVIASGLGSNYIERLFGPQYNEPVMASVELAKEFYDEARKHTLNYAVLASQGYTLPPGFSTKLLKSSPSDATPAVKSAFEGQKSVEVSSSAQGDIIRAVVPTGVIGNHPTSVLVVETVIPLTMTNSIQKIKDSYEDYVSLAFWVTPLKVNFLLILGFFTLAIMFLSLWVSLRLANRITRPVKDLLEATQAVAGGDLTVHVKGSRDSEIDRLIDAFNTMVFEIKESKESLQSAYSESNRRRLYLEALIENIQSGVLLFSQTGEAIATNPSAVRILGLLPEDLYGSAYDHILMKIGSEEVLSFAKEINLRTLDSIEREIQTAIAGRKVTLRVFISSLRDADSKYLGLLVVFDDLTNIVKAQHALAWQEVARRIAHEIKNPLTPIKLSTERMLKKWQNKDPDFDKAFERCTNTIIREVDGLRHMVDEFTKFGKMPEVVMKPIRIKAVFDDVAMLYRDYKGVRLSFEGEDLTALLDIEQFKRALINIFDNAIEAMGKTGDIKTTLRRLPGVHRLSMQIADSGPGISQEDKEKLFMPYFSTKKDGTGLGLAITDRIIAEHGGTIRVVDNSPHGSVFVIELPTARDGG